MVKNFVGMASLIVRAKRRLGHHPVLRRSRRVRAAQARLEVREQHRFLGGHCIAPIVLAPASALVLNELAFVIQGAIDNGARPGRPVDACKNKGEAGAGIERALRGAEVKMTYQKHTVEAHNYKTTKTAPPYTSPSLPPPSIERIDSPNTSMAVSPRYSSSCSARLMKEPSGLVARCFASAFVQKYP